MWPAWPDLDLNAAQVIDPGILPEHDLLLTDLVIPALAPSILPSIRRVGLGCPRRSVIAPRSSPARASGNSRVARGRGRRLWVLDGGICKPQRTWLFAPVHATPKACQAEQVCRPASAKRMGMVISGDNQALLASGRLRELPFGSAEQRARLGDEPRPLTNRREGLLSIAHDFPLPVADVTCKRRRRIPIT